MSENNEEIVLAHDNYITANSINVDELPAEIDKELDAVNALIDKYEADASDANFDAVESASKSLEGKIKAWHEAKQTPKAPEAPKAVEPKQTEPTPVAQPKASTPAQAPADDDDDEENSWSYTSLMK